MVRRHGPLFQPHYPRRNQYTPIYEVRSNSERVVGCFASHHVILESAVGIGEFIGLGIGFSLGVYGDGSDFLLFYGAVTG